MTGRVTAAEAVSALASEVWESLLVREPYYAAKAGRSVERIARGSLADAEAVSDAARARLRRLDCIDRESLSRTERLTARYLTHVLRDEIDEPERWWTGFGITPYIGGAHLSVLPELVFQHAQLGTPAHTARYLSLLHDFAGSIDGLRERTLAQAERGWRIPRPALPGVRATLRRVATGLSASLVPDEHRAVEAVRQQLALVVKDRIVPACNALLAMLDADYERRASENVGLGQYPHGHAAYRRWVRYHLSSEAEPDEIHATGHSEVDRLRSAMAEHRSSAFGWKGEESEFHARLRSDPRAKAASPQTLEETYRAHLERMQALLPKLMRHPPRARPTLCRLQPTLEVGMTFGFYDPPSAAREHGIYYYSGYGLENRLQLNAGPLMFHELMPGHHVHIARQLENTRLPDIRRQTFGFNTFNEGWAEYSAGLGEELGLYEDPYDRYGWLAHQRFIAQRLVVDTGLNWLGWSLERAHQYMAENTLEASPQIESETLRYSTDMPAQALGYRMGFLQFRALRAEAREILGDRFDLADFHEAILSEGSLPMLVLQSSVKEWALERRAAAA